MKFTPTQNKYKQYTKGNKIVTQPIIHTQTGQPLT